jgi:long-chain fatty acid transport protein
MGDVDLRAGYVFEQSPVPDQYLTPQIPDANRRGFSAGIGYWVSEGVRLDFAYQFLQFDDRTVSPVVETQTPGQISGTYTTTWTVLGIGVSYFWK